MKYLITATAVASLVAGCANTNGSGGAVYKEAGYQLETGDFGNATLNNTLVQTGQRDYVVSLGLRFDAEVESTITFAFNSAQLDGAARTTLVQQASWIKQFPEVRFKVYGHTDLVGSNAYNKSLGLRRAQAAVNFLVDQGISRSRLQAVVSFGETRPVINTTNMERRNRRTVTEVSGFVKNHPALLNGKYAAVIFREYVASAKATSGSVSTASVGEVGGG